jgi:short-subunit dehydrogenase involved in D-alanine esterification of teichoic acids
MVLTNKTVLITGASSGIDRGGGSGETPKQFDRDRASASAA